MENDDIELHMARHPVTRSLLARLWFRLRCFVWPYDISRDSLETVEIDVPDHPADAKPLHILNRVSSR